MTALLAWDTELDYNSQLTKKMGNENHAIVYTEITIKDITIVPFTGPPLLEMKFFLIHLPSYCSFFQGFLNQLFNTTHFTSEYNIILQTDAFIASNEHVVCWRQMLYQLPNSTYVKMIASHSYLSPKMSSIMLWRSKRYLNAQWHLLLH